MAPTPSADDTQRRVGQLEARERELTEQATETRTQRTLLAGLAALLFGSALTGASVVVQDRSRLDVIESRMRDVERTSRETQTDQRALATTLSEVRTDLRVIGSQITDVRDRAARIEAQLSQPAGFTPTRR